MIKKLFDNKFLNSGPSDSILSAAFVITLSGLASRALGLLRDSILASKFSAGDTLDVYYAAFRIPDLIYNLLILGALSAAFIPVFTGLISNDKDDEAWDLSNSILNILMILIIVLSLIFCIFAPFFMELLAPGFSTEKTASLVTFTRIMFLSPLFLGISGIFGGILTSFRRFLFYAIAPLFYNLGIIIGASVFVKFMGPVGLAWGVVLGAFMHMMIQYPAARSLGFRHQFSAIKNLRNINARRVFRLMIPRTLGIAVGQINLFVITIFASMLTAGSLAIFTLAQNLQGVPVGIFGASFAIAAFPTLAAFASKNKSDDFVRTFSQTFRQILFFVIPISIFILLLRAQLVRVVLGHGKYDWQNTILTFQCLGAFTLSLFAQSTIPLLARSFYALHDTKTPFYIALVAEAVNIIGVVLLKDKLAVIGLALAFTLANLVQMLLLLFVLRSRFDTLDDKKILSSLFKISIAAIAAGFTVQVMKYVTANLVDMDTFAGVFIQLAASGGIGVLIYIGLSYITKIEEFVYFKNSLTAKIFKAKKVIVEDTSDVSGV